MSRQHLCSQDYEPLLYQGTTLKVEEPLYREHGFLKGADGEIRDGRVVSAEAFHEAELFDFIQRQVGELARCRWWSGQPSRHA